MIETIKINIKKERCSKNPPSLNPSKGLLSSLVFLLQGRRV